MLGAGVRRASHAGEGKLPPPPPPPPPPLLTIIIYSARERTRKVGTASVGGAGAGAGGIAGGGKMAGEWRQPAASAAAWLLAPPPAAASRSASACSISAWEGIFAPKELRYSRKKASSFLCRKVGLFLRIPTAWRGPLVRRGQWFGVCFLGSCARGERRQRQLLLRRSGLGCQSNLERR